MDVMSLPAHPRPFDEPAPSDMVTGLSGNKAYRWILTDSERAHIAEMLHIDAASFGGRGSIMSVDRMVCETCGKHSGLDDLVHNALYAGIHCVSFMVDVIANGFKASGPSPAHDIVCSHCNTKHHSAASWDNPQLSWYD